MDNDYNSQKYREKLIYDNFTIDEMSKCMDFMKFYIDLQWRGCVLDKDKYNEDRLEYCFKLLGYYAQNKYGKYNGQS